jgi:hypothetical protein
MSANYLHKATPLLLSLFFLSSCYSYRIMTHAQPGTEVQSIKAVSLFWGLAQSPKQLLTPNCDSLGLNGMAEVRMRTNAGYIFLTVITLGIYCPMKVEWKCSKPCQQVQHL